MNGCDHQPKQIEGLDVAACEDCGLIEWAEGGAELEPAEGFARLFGRFELIDRLPALRAPGPEVLVYRPPSGRARSLLSVFPAHAWLQIDDRLWMTHNGDQLLLAPVSPERHSDSGRLTARLTRPEPARSPR